MNGIYNQFAKTLTVVIENKVYTVNNQNVFFNELLDAYRNQDAEKFVIYFDEAEAKKTLINKHNSSGVSYEDGVLYYKGRELDHTYADRISEAVRLKLPIEPMIKFFGRLMENPSAQSIEQLPDFLAHKNLPITEDGCFLGYKVVQSDMYSKYADRSGKMELVRGKQLNGKVYNGVGEVIECPRRAVDDDKNKTCSYGLHIGGLLYSGPGGSYHSRGDTVIICKVDPKDVVSVPTDYEGQKMRVCKYEVTGIFVEPLNSIYEDEEQEEVDYNDLDLYDEISFFYTDKTGERSYRECMVKENHGSYIIGNLLYGDPSYKDGSEIRRFDISNMEDISILF